MTYRQGRTVFSMISLTGLMIIMICVQRATHSWGIAGLVAVAWLLGAVRGYADGRCDERDGRTERGQS